MCTSANPSYGDGGEPKIRFGCHKRDYKVCNNEKAETAYPDNISFSLGPPSESGIFDRRVDGRATRKERREPATILEGAEVPEKNR
jgi:hypothetical protein